MLRPSPNHGTQRLPKDDDDDESTTNQLWSNAMGEHVSAMPRKCYRNENLSNGTHQAVDAA